MPPKRSKTTKVLAATVKPEAPNPRETRARRGSSPVEIVDPEEIARTRRASKRKARTEVGQEGDGEAEQDPISQTIEQQEQHDIRDDSVEPDRHTFDMKAVDLERIAAGLESLVDLACLASRIAAMETTFQDNPEGREIYHGTDMDRTLAKIGARHLGLGVDVGTAGGNAIDPYELPSTPPS